MKAPFDEVAFPMPRQLPQLDLLGHESAARKRGAPASTHGLLLAQGFDHRLLEPASRMRVDRSVNRFVADTLVGTVGIHVAKFGSNPFRALPFIFPLIPSRNYSGVWTP
ncbi:hypothetical protein [Ralstonia pseudosolanacearum]|uniref:hypothetical protein n=1 Tax=Ralstonia pseudosolanacearum TaxID=1310165 RepID=UPI00138A5E9B|nr:hypothetical protein [Ralstonia pseudosolanacearum]MDC6284404.1 hypothetical protein [Ralstonia pseudosolanacearum]